MRGGHDHGTEHRSMSKPDLDELETLIPPPDLPDDATCEVTAGDLRALTELIPCAREHVATFGTYVVPPHFTEPEHVTD
jgi:hypothetical protein